MSITPDPARDALPADHPIVSAAVEALRHFGDQLDRATAAMLLPMWRHFRELSDREFRSVLLTFPAGDDISPGSWLSDESLGRVDPADGGWASGSMR